MSADNTSSSDPVHFMLDLETLDTRSTAVILSIGACIVHDTHDNPDHTFYVELDQNLQSFRTQSIETVEWWAAQGNCPDNGTTILPTALSDLGNYLHSYTDRPIVWCKGTDFDIAILNDAYRHYGMKTPWKYNDVRDFRTLKKMFADSMIVTLENPNPHNALADAIFQAKQLASIGLELK